VGPQCAVGTARGVRKSGAPGGISVIPNHREDFSRRLGPCGKARRVFSCLFVEPVHGNERAIGFDLASNPTRREALLLSHTTGRLVATGRIVLVQETRDQFGFLVF